MRITKYGHSCLLVEEGDARILFDPGVYSVVPDLDKLDAILLTHTHQDHIAIPTLKKLVEMNPRARIFGNSEVVGLLAKEDIEVDRLEAGEQAVVQNVIIEGVGSDHAIIHSSIPRIKNTGYLIANSFLYPGDALTVPNSRIKVLALPVVAPWMKMSETIDYLLAMRAPIVFPVHDAIVAPNNPYHKTAENKAKEAGSQWVVLENGVAHEF